MKYGLVGTSSKPRIFTQPASCIILATSRRNQQQGSREGNSTVLKQKEVDKQTEE